MTDYESIWRTQEEIRTVVNAVLGECIWDLSYNDRRSAIELELTITLDDDAIGSLCCEFSITADYDGVGMSVGIAKPLLLSVSKTRHIEKYEQESVILCTRAFYIH